jgi:hypothetical protein
MKNVVESCVDTFFSALLLRIICVVPSGYSYSLPGFIGTGTMYRIAKLSLAL